MTISIIGCGWLGLPLGETLTSAGHDVRGSTTSPEKRSALSDAGIEPHLLRLTPEMEADEAAVEALFGADVLFLNVPPSRGTDDLTAYHSAQIRAVQEQAAAGSVEWIVFASSTGVYPALDRVVTEADQPPGAFDALPGERHRASGEAILAVEQQLTDDDRFDTTVVRFGGLYGGDRHPARYLAGRTSVSRPDAPVNLIHRDDCIGIVRAILDADRSDAREEVRGEVFNAVSDAHPSRRAVYTSVAEALGLEPPQFDDGEETGDKTVSNQRLHDVLGYTFIHPSPLPA